MTDFTAGITPISTAIGDGDDLIGVHHIGAGTILGMTPGMTDGTAGTTHGTEVTMDGDGLIAIIIMDGQAGMRLMEVMLIGVDIPVHTIMEDQRLERIAEQQ